MRLELRSCRLYDIQHDLLAIAEFLLASTLKALLGSVVRCSIVTACKWF